MSVRSEDVAREVGVSRATVSQILNGRGERFAETTRQKVLATAQRLGYRPSVAARTLATGTSDIVVVLLPFTHLSGNLQAVLERATIALAEHGITLVLRQHAPGTTTLAQAVQSLRPRAVFSLEALTPDQISVLEKAGVPHSGPTVSDEVDFGFDRMIGRAQANHLASRGFTRLAFIQLDDERFETWAPPREQGVREVAADLGLAEPLSLRARLEQSSLSATITAIPPHTGVACYNDDLALALMGAARIAGREIPRDLGFIGMDASPLGACFFPALTSIRIDIAAAAANMIEGLLATARADGAPAPRPVALTVVERASS